MALWCRQVDQKTGQPLKRPAGHGNRHWGSITVAGSGGERACFAMNWLDRAIR